MRKVKVQYDMTFLATPPASQAIDEIVNLDWILVDFLVDHAFH